MGLGENAGVGTIEAPATQGAGTNVAAADVNAGGDEPITWGGDAGDETASSDAGNAQGVSEQSDSTDANEGADAAEVDLASVFDAAMTPTADAGGSQTAIANGQVQPQATGQQPPAVPASDAGPAPTLSAALVDKLKGELSPELSDSLVAEINKTFSDLHSRIGQVDPKVTKAAEQIQTVAQRQQQEDQQRHEAQIDAMFDKMAAAGKTVYGTGQSRNLSARRAVYAEADRLAMQIQSVPGALQRLRSTLPKGASVAEALIAKAHAEIYGSQPTTSQAVKQVQDSVIKRHGQRTVQPGGRAGTRSSEEGTTFEDLKQIWTKK